MDNGAWQTFLQGGVREMRVRRMDPELRRSDSFRPRQQGSPGNETASGSEEGPEKKKSGDKSRRIRICGKELDGEAGTTSGGGSSSGRVVVVTVVVYLDRLFVAEEGAWCRGQWPVATRIRVAAVGDSLEASERLAQMASIDAIDAVEHMLRCARRSNEKAVFTFSQVMRLHSRKERPPALLAIAARGTAAARWRKARSRHAAASPPSLRPQEHRTLCIQ
ncbi:hypothetical protein BDW02DRAFT_578651 [Decorospora gaudefroyi]|uniref:Uncharacterized protein n=1 Tax=Decorospora gaudefroyi TaxID=184978 RepID=A0A6A5KIA3_9PLEO|nr:hypothetical protein BDW02DRAFT_578651 [Decorospora gaudefroyi]